MAKKISGIKIKIGGDTVALNNALKSVNDKSVKLNSELNLINRQLKFNPSSTVLLSQKQQVLKENIENSKNKLKQLEDVQQDIERQYKTGEIDDGQYRAFQRELEQTKSKLNSYQSQLKIAQNQQGDFSKKVEISKETLKKQKETLKSGIKTIGKWSSVTVAAIGAAATASLNYASEFEKAFAKTSTLLDEKKIDFSKYKEDIIKVSNETGLAASEVANSTYEAISASVDPDKAVGFVNTAHKLAEGGFTELANSVDILSTVLNAYHMSADKSNHVSDVLIQTQNKGKVVVGELAQYMGKVLPVASSYNVSLEQVATNYAILTAQGIKASNATTYQKSLFNELAKSSSVVSQKLKETTGKTFPELMNSGKSVTEVLDILKNSVNGNNIEFANLFKNSNAKSAALALMSAGTKKFNKQLKEMKNSSGAAEKAYDKMANTTEHKLEVLKTNIQNSAISIGSELLPVVSDLLDDAEEHLPEIQKTASSIGKNVSKDIRWLINNGKTILNILESVAIGAASIYAKSKVQKIYKSTYELYTAIKLLASAKKAETLATETETTAQNALNTAQKANIAGAIASGLIILTSVIWKANEATQNYTKATSIWTDEEKALHEEIKKRTDALKDAQTAREEEIDGIEGTYAHYDKLCKELKKITDENGNVKKGYEKRAKFITTTLSDALGIEIEYNKGIIQNYKDIRQEIEKTIKVKKNEARLNAFKPEYENALKTASGGTNSSDYKLYSKELQAQKKAEKNLKEAKKALKKHVNITGALGTSARDVEYEKKENAVKQAEKDYKEANKKVEQAFKNYVQNRDIIKKYDEAYSEFLSGHQKNAKALLDNMNDDLILAGKSTNDTMRKILKEQKTKAEEEYIEIKSAFDKGEKGVTKAMVDNAKSRKMRANAEWISFGNNVGEKAENAAGKIGKKAGNVNTKENKENAKKETDKLRKTMINSFLPTDEEKETLKKSGKKIINSAASKSNKEYAKSKSKGIAGWFVNGFVTFLTGHSAIASVFKAGYDFVRNALFGAQEAQKSKSPSKETRKLGQYFSEGYAIGINDKAELALKNASDMAKKAVNHLNTSANVDISASINNRAASVAKAISSKSASPKVYTSSPNIQISFGNMQIRDESDINAIADRVSERIAEVIVMEGKSRGL